VPEKVAAQVKGLRAFFTGVVRKEGKSWYHPDYSFGLDGPPVKTTIAIEVS
jgi:hypothetical protein